MVDSTYHNVIGIITHAYDMAGRKGQKDAEFWKAAFEKKKNMFYNSIFTYLGISAHIVAIENDTEDMEKTEGGWTKLIDGTIQPYDLYDTCMKVLDSNGDSLGFSIVKACFKSDSVKGPDKGFKVEAKKASEEELDSDEKQFHDFYVETTKGNL